MKQSGAVVKQKKLIKSVIKWNKQQNFAYLDLKI